MSAADLTFARIVVFGDSLSDTGNAGRFSNGPVWVEGLARRLKLPLEPARNGGGNFAVGGARLDPASGWYSVRAQVDLFLRAGGSQRPDTLFVVYGGGNDLRAAIGSAQSRSMIATAVTSAGGIIRDLIAAGATDILVPKVPDVGMTPEVRARGPRAVEEGRALTEAFNAAVDRTLSEVAGAGTSGVRIYRLDVQAIAERVKAAPQSFGFRDVTTPCGSLPSCEGYLFWDRIHPTAAAHDQMAEAAFRVLQGQPALP